MSLVRIRLTVVPFIFCLLLSQSAFAALCGRLSTGDQFDKLNSILDCLERKIDASDDGLPPPPVEASFFAGPVAVNVSECRKKSRQVICTLSFTSTKDMFLYVRRATHMFDENGEKYFAKSLGRLSFADRCYGTMELIADITKSHNLVFANVPMGIKKISRLKLSYNAESNSCNCAGCLDKMGTARDIHVN